MDSFRGGLPQRDEVAGAKRIQANMNRGFVFFGGDFRLDDVCIRKRFEAKVNLGFVRSAGGWVLRFVWSAGGQGSQVHSDVRWP
jgi:hypothetical protein